MSNLKAWWGTQWDAGVGRAGEVVILVARTSAEAARLAGVTPGRFPFRFAEWTGEPIPPHVARPGVYRVVFGTWVREEAPKGPPDLEEGP